MLPRLVSGVKCLLCGALYLHHVVGAGGYIFLEVLTRFLHGVVSAIDGDMAPNLKVGQEIVRIDPRYFRPAEVETLLGDPSKAKEMLGWEPQITVQEMCQEMVEEDYKTAQRYRLLKDNGFELPIPTEN